MGIFTVKVQAVTLLGGSHHGETRQVDVSALDTSISRTIALPKKKEVNWYTANQVCSDEFFEIEYYRLIYAFDPVFKPYLVIEGGNADLLFDMYINEQMKKSTIQDIGRTLDKLIPGLNQHLPPELIYCPECGDSQIASKVKSRIVHLNDVHKWSLEQIADYLETLPIDLRVREDAIIKRPHP